MARILGNGNNEGKCYNHTDFTSSYFWFQIGGDVARVPDVDEADDDYIAGRRRREVRQDEPDQEQAEPDQERSEPAQSAHVLVVADAAQIQV